MEYKSFMEALKGNQHKIDKNKNGKVDAHDFKLLRKEETEELEEATTGATKLVHTRKGADGAKYHIMQDSPTDYSIHREHKGKTTHIDTYSSLHRAKSVLDNEVKEEVELDEATVNTKKYSWGTMKTVHHGSDFSIPLHPEHHEAIAKLKDQQEHKFKTEDGKHWTAKRSGDDVHFQGANGGNSTTVKHSTMSESVEELDEIRRMKTKLNALDAVSHMSVARQKLTNLMKSGKARGALIANKRRTLNMGEEVEGLDEKSDQAKQNKTMKNMMDASRGARYKLNNPVPDAEPEHKTAQAHNKAIGRALRNEAQMTTTKDKAGKLVSFKYEGDWKKTTKADAKKDPAGKVANMAGQAMQKMAKTNEQAPVAPVPDRKYIKGTPENKALKASRKPINGMPTNKIKEEKDEEEYGYEGDMALNQLATLTRCAEMIKEILKPDTDMPEWVQSKITLATDYIQTAADYMHSEMNEAKSVEVKVNAAGDAAHEEKWEAVKKVKKPVKESFDEEGNLISNKVSYKEFMLEYTPGPGGVTQVKGRSYGASYTDPEGADDYDDKKPMKPAAEKRGRGRPAGAQSGARKNLGNSKLHSK